MSENSTERTRWYDIWGESGDPERMFRDRKDFAEAMGGEKIGTFTIAAVPEGDAPDDIRGAWVGVAIPIREFPWEHRSTYARGKVNGEKVQYTDPVPVTIMDAIVALDAVGTELANRASRYWMPRSSRQTLGHLTFHVSEGYVTLV